MEDEVKALEQEVLEDLNKLLIKLKDFESVKLANSDYGSKFVPTKYDASDEDLDENDNLKSDALFKEEWGDSVKFKEQYKSIKLSSIKDVLELLVDKNQLKDATHVLGQYYNSNC